MKILLKILSYILTLCWLSKHSGGWNSDGDGFGSSALEFKGFSKFLVIEVQSGLGNRIQTIASSAILALLMDRVLVIDWPVDNDCGSHITDLFKEASAPKHSGHALLYHTENMYTSAGMDPQYVVQECNIDFTHDMGSFKDFWFLLNPSIHEAMNLHCDIIRIRSNIKFASLIEKSRVFQKEEFSRKLSPLGKDPFSAMIRRLFNNPVDTIMDKISKFKGDYALTTNHRWMSLHSRYENTYMHTYIDIFSHTHLHIMNRTLSQQTSFS